MVNEEVKILCVDDEQNVLNALKRLFLDDDYTILAATSGQEGLELLEREHVQLVVSDYRMPGMSGVEFLKEVCSRRPETVRIVLSGYADAAAIVSAINEGQIYKFVPKPWNDDELRVTVKRALERYFLYQKNKELTAELQEKNDALTMLNNELEKLLKEKSEHLEFRSRVLAAHQNILDSIPVGILGIDLNNIIVLRNALWCDIVGEACCALGESIKGSVSGDIIEFIDEVKNSRNAVRKLEIKGRRGRLVGALMERANDQAGIILAFIREEDISS